MEEKEDAEMQAAHTNLMRTSLSPQQRALLSLTIHGLTPDQIAQRLELTLPETQGALERLQELCRASSRRHLITLAILKDWV